MFKSIVDDIRHQFDFGNAVNKLIIVNVAVYALLIITFAFMAIFGGGNSGQTRQIILSYLAANSDIWIDLKRPWVLFTHMFVHEGFFHLAWNMLGLWYFGRIFGGLMGDRRIIPLYILAGLMGFLFYVIGVNFIYPSGSIAIGASAAVLGILVASVMVAPEYRFNLILVGPVPLKYIALGVILMNFAGLAGLQNVGGVFGHFGGMVMGWYFVYLINNGSDPSIWMNKTGNSILSFFDTKPKQKKSPLSVSHKSKILRKSKGSQAKNSNSKQASASNDFQERLDRILDKISNEGIGSLSDDDKDFLDKASKQKE